MFAEGEGEELLAVVLLEIDQDAPHRVLDEIGLREMGDGQDEADRDAGDQNPPEGLRRTRRGAAVAQAKGLECALLRGIPHGPAPRPAELDPGAARVSRRDGRRRGAPRARAAGHVGEENVVEDGFQQIGARHPRE